MYAQMLSPQQASTATGAKAQKQVQKQMLNFEQQQNEERHQSALSQTHLGLSKLRDVLADESIYDLANKLQESNEKNLGVIESLVKKFKVFGSDAVSNGAKDVHVENAKGNINDDVVQKPTFRGQRNEVPRDLDDTSTGDNSFAAELQRMNQKLEEFKMQNAIIKNMNNPWRARQQNLHAGKSYSEHLSSLLEAFVDDKDQALES